MTINIGSIISTIAGVIEPSGDRLEFNGLSLTDNSQAPIGLFLSFLTLLEVKNYFGSSSAEADFATIYFNGFDNATRRPAKIHFQQHPLTAKAAYLRGGPLTGMTLAQLQAITGTLTLTSDAETQTTGTIDLSGATSFSNAAALITADLALVFTIDPVCTYDSITGAFVITSTTTGVTSIMSFGTGTISTDLKLTAATGAVQSIGADIGVLTDTLDSIIVENRNWVGLTTIFEPDLTDKTEIAVWSNAQNDDYLYIAWDTDTTTLNSGSSADFSSTILDAEYDGSTVHYGAIDYAAFMAGTIASIDTGRDNGWITLAYKSQSGLAANISSTTDATTLEAKRCNFYGDWASRTQNEKMLMHGAMAGVWKWIDDFLGQIYLRSGFQESGLSLLKQIRRLPYNLESYETLKSVWLGDVINPAIDIGIIAAGIALDTTQKTLIDSLTGVDDSGEVVSQVGWFLDIDDPSAAERSDRESPIIIFVYTSGQSIHRLHIPVFLAQ